ncbi:MAG: PQQ-binding-like beta-propeller repeat protein, partial [Candidatus Sericytochromatia bacterium]
MKTFLLLISLMLLLPAHAREAAWPQFQRDASHQGQSSWGEAIRNPKILWRTEVGILSYLNNPVIAEGKVFVPSSGPNWSQADGPSEKAGPNYRDHYSDGIYVLDFNTGRPLEFWPTGHNARSVAYGSGWVVWTNTSGWQEDAGEINGRNLSSGKSWKYDLGTDFNEPQMHGITLADELVLAGDSRGRLHALDLNSGQLRWQQALTGEIRAHPALDGETIYAASTRGEVAAYDQAGKLRWKTMLSHAYPAWSRRTDRFPVEIYAAPTLVGDLLLIAYARNTTYPHPALLALDRRTGAEVWRASDPKQLLAEHANLRSSPAIYGDLAIVANGIGNAVLGIDWHSGVVKWVSRVGFEMNVHWPSPAINAGQVLLPRQDGGLYSLNASDG